MADSNDYVVKTEEDDDDEEQIDDSVRWIVTTAGQPFRGVLCISKDFELSFLMDKLEDSSITYSLSVQNL
jgi:hypothetical protein